MYLYWIKIIYFFLWIYSVYNLAINFFLIYYNSTYIKNNIWLKVMNKNKNYEFFKSINILSKVSKLLFNTHQYQAILTDFYCYKLKFTWYWDQLIFLQLLDQSLLFFQCSSFHYNKIHLEQQQTHFQKSLW